MSAWPYRVTTKYSFYLVHTYGMLNKNDYANCALKWEIQGFDGELFIHSCLTSPAKRSWDVICHVKPEGRKPDPLFNIIAQVYRLSAVHCQVTRFSQRVPGYLTRYSVSADEISFDKKISQSDCLSTDVRPWITLLPLHLVISTGFMKAKWDYYSKYDV